MELSPTHPIVSLPCAASDIQGRRIRFAPLKRGWDDLVAGTIFVVFRDLGCGVAAAYLCPIDRTPAVYWFDQEEVDDLFSRTPRF
jgi:hypothetical protein